MALQKHLITAAMVLMGLAAETHGYVTRDTLPAKSAGADSLVVVTHGINTNAEDWVDDMAAAIDAQLGSDDSWDVWAYDWRDRADTFFPWTFRSNAIAEGQALGSYLAGLAEPYQNIHFIGHSAGSIVMDAAADQFPALNSPGRQAVIHTTFLDAANPEMFGTLDLGRNADFAVHYIANDGLIYTEDNLTYAHNVNVTGLAVDIPLSHSFPHQWYLDSIWNAGDARMFHDDWGYAVSREFSGGLPGHDDWTRGAVTSLRCIAGDINCDGVVGLLDLDILGRHYEQIPALWTEGDLSGDLTVGLLDLDILGREYGTIWQVPEPGVGWIGIAALMLIRNRKVACP